MFEKSIFNEPEVVFLADRKDCILKRQPGSLVKESDLTTTSPAEVIGSGETFDRRRRRLLPTRLPRGKTTPLKATFAADLSPVDKLPFCLLSRRC